MTTKSLKRKAPEAAPPKDAEITTSDFDALFAEWLLARSGEFDEETEEQQDERCNREDDLAQRILTMPANREYLIFRKFEVADYCITKHGDATWGETMALTALDGIKADLLRFARAREVREAKRVREAAGRQA